MLLIFIALLNIITTSRTGFLHFSRDQAAVRQGQQQHADQNCVCVPYWQCKDDFSGLVDDGVDIMDIRILKDKPTNYGCTGDFDVCCRIECGKPSRKSHPDYEYYDDDMPFRILGENNEANYAEFPWMLGVLEDRVYRCGASLIHPQVALTAAHCVLDGRRYKIRAGEWNWLSRNEPLLHQDRMTGKIIVHPQYHPPSLRNDIALLILESPFKLAENVGIVCLPKSRTLGPSYENVATPPIRPTTPRCLVTGWGKNSVKKGTYQSVLKKVDLPLVNVEVCVQFLRSSTLGMYFNLHGSFICAGGEHNSKDTCKGDGGSPLVCPVVTGSGRYEQVGIVSWGLTCGEHNAPGVYVNVVRFSEWIDEMMGRHNFDTNIYKL